MFSLHSLSIRNTNVELVQLKQLSRLPNLESLRMERTPASLEANVYSTTLISLAKLQYLDEMPVRNGEELADLPKFIASLPGEVEPLPPESWLPDSAFEIQELPNFQTICDELETALRESVLRYVQGK